MRYSADLHIHSCLSPCGDLSMSPAAIARTAAERGLSLIALTDHNSALNVPSFASVCRSAGIEAAFGIEVTTREEVHVLALFEDTESALRLGEILYAALPPLMNDPEKLGDQVYVNEDEEILGEVDKYLVNAVALSIDEVAREIFALGGLFVPAHIDRPSMSLSSQLGFIPEMAYSALEITEWPCLMNTATHPLVSNSDAHYLDGIGRRRTFFEAPSPTFRAFRDALRRNKVLTSFS